MKSTRPTPTSLNTARERGMAVMLTALLLVFTIPAVGLAIDAGVLYLVRSKLSSACDAAALATARNLNLGQTIDEQMAAAQTRGIAFFDANFPTGYLGTTGVTPNIVIDRSSTNTITVTASATGTASLYFMRILGSSATLASSSGQASRRNVNIMMVLDRSASMGGAPCRAMVSASKAFADMFVNGRDRLGMVSFGNTISRDYLPTTDFKNPASPISAAIGALERECLQGTNISDGYSDAYQQLVGINQPLALNILLLFTDGYPNSFSARFPIKTLPDVRLSDRCPFVNNRWTECAVPKSTCRDDNGRDSTDPLWGTFEPRAGLYSFTGGPRTTLVARPSDRSQALPADRIVGCKTANPAGWTGDDYAFIPDEDLYGVSTSGYLDRNTVRFPAGHPYAGRLRIETQDSNALTRILCDNAARRARDHPTLQIVTYTIGLGNFVDHELLRRMANDLASPTYDNTRRNGLYVHAPTIAEIGVAYSRIASEVLRLAQ